MARKSDRIKALSKAVIDSLPAPASGRVEWWDESTPSLCVRITPNGHKSFYWLGRSGGRLKRCQLGVWPHMTVMAARDEAKRLSGDASQGKAVSARGKGHRGEWTLGQLWDWYFRTHAKPHKRTWKWDLRQWESRLKDWSSRKVSSITRLEVQERHLSIGDDAGPYAGNKLLELLGTMYRKGNIGDPAAVPCPDPCRGIKRFPRSERERYLDGDELPKFLAAVAKLQREVSRDFFLLCLWTGARRGNVMAMKWDDVNMDRGTWTIDASESKNKTTMTVMLTPPAIEVLNRRKKTRRGKWVLPGQGPTGHYTNPRDAMKQIRKYSKLKDIRIHDLRRTLGSWVGMTEPIQTVAKVLGHRSVRSAQIYSRLAEKELAKTLAKTTDAMQGK